MDGHDPDAGWKPNRRPQSTVARNFASALDDLFRLDGGLDDLSKNVHQRKQTVTIRNEELEALEARLRETEERLRMARSSPSASHKDSQRQTPIKGSFPGAASQEESGSPLAHRPARITSVTTESSKRNDIPGALPETPTSYNSAEYVMVDRPRSAQKDSEEERET